FGVGRALIKDVFNVLQGKRPEGGSTITQQVAKNVLLTNEVSVGRKLKEAILATQLEQTLTKKEILELYLNEIWLGYRSYGVGGHVSQIAPGWRQAAMAKTAPAERRAWRAALITEASGRVETVEGQAGQIVPADVAWAKAGKGFAVGDVVWVEPAETGGFRL